MSQEEQQQEEDEYRSRLTMEELREFARLPWIRCTGCNRVTGRYQKEFDRILAEKEKDYVEIALKYYQTFLGQGFDDITAQSLADRQGQIIAGINFNRKVRDQLGLKEECCFNTLLNPVIMPLGSGIPLDKEIEVGERRVPTRQYDKDGNPIPRRYLAR